MHGHKPEIGQFRKPVLKVKIMNLIPVPLTLNPPPPGPQTAFEESPSQLGACVARLPRSAAPACCAVFSGGGGHVGRSKV